MHKKNIKFQSEIITHALNDYSLKKIRFFKCQNSNMSQNCPVKITKAQKDPNVT